jgi:hypothetical protein
VTDPVLKFRRERDEAIARCDVLSSDLNALEIALQASGAGYEKLKQENLTLHEKVSALESREVCGAAHDNVETCGYCQRDGLIGLIQLLSHNKDIPESIRSNMLMNHRFIDAVGSPAKRQCVGEDK